ncbi:D-lactate dehydrogenase [Paraburkholderia sp. SARCC-3016]|uniref:D-lactate dehydrogenase n=1 Tax=Paraburkholderia sp. SARCC-3016 TaxID=3058611 RepID=UPI0028073A81|nr:D-lactate dehydrogenase [Paraburkholderia sp. SARCC-3016]MDQ7980968.1 D-lactate dehydrogenase [Paraburkholderia sp. SARCC-3016]
MSTFRQARTGVASSRDRKDQGKFIEDLKQIVGAKFVLTSASETRRYRRGFRFGEGNALAVVRPGTLVEQWNVLRACVANDVIVITQASNTGLTGGSTPDGNDYDREVVIVSTTRMRKLYVIDDGRQVVCLPGTTLDQLEKTLAPIGREPHSVIGSSCIGASVFGGICNNSGGALVNRGPAFTQLALYAQIDEDGQLNLVNHLGIELGDTPERILGRLENRDFSDQDVKLDAGAASDRNYARHVREIDADTPARYNADTHRLYEASGSAGKLMVFAVRLDTFPIDQDSKVFYIGTNQPDELTDIRRHVLKNFSRLPISGEYLHRDAFDIAAVYGKDTFLAILYLGTSRLPGLFALKSRFDALFERMGFLPAHLTDRVMQFASKLFPDHLPRRMREYRDKYEHHLLLKVTADCVAEAQAYLQGYFAHATGSYFECTDKEGEKAFLHRFAAAGAAVRYRAIHAREVEDIVALDIALRRNDRDWVEKLPREIEEPIAIKLYYGHFLCHVFHQDYIVEKGYDCLDVEHRMWKLLDARGAEYPAEHNVGHLYYAKPVLAEFYRRLDPCNCFNPGIGKTSKFARYQEAEEEAAS